jgi:hypothetical protein
MESKQEGSNIFIMIAVWVIGVIFLYIGVTLFSWGLAVGAFLISSVIIYSQIEELKECLKSLNVDSIIPVSVKLYNYVGILHAILTILFCLWFLSLFSDSVIYNKSKDQMITELIQPNKAGSVLILTGIWVISNSVLLIWYDYLVKGFKDFTISEVFSNFHRVIKILAGILILLLGMFLYNFCC